MLRAKPVPTNAEAWRIGPLIVAGDPRPIELLHLFLDGWPLSPARSNPEPDIEIVAEGDAFTVTSLGRVERYASAMDAANALGGAAIAAHVASDPGLICLHGGAIETPKGIVALVGDTGVGKSSVALMLAAQGCRLWGDDRIGLRLPDQAVSLGLAPKMRWPFPPESGEIFAQFIDERAAWWGETAALLRMRPGEAAPLDSAAALAAIVMLERNGARESLTPFGLAESVRALLPHCFAPHMPAARLVDTLQDVARAVKVERLSYDQSHRASSLLAERYG